MAERPDLEVLAGAVADGDRIDWDALGDTTAELAALRDLDSLRRAFRSVAGAAESGTGAPPEPVRFVWGHLRVLEPIGSGSWGEVYRAFDPLLQREVALKLWRTDTPGSGPGRRRTLHEARLLARIRHPNVVTVHGVDTHEQRAGLWTDLVRGETLEAALAERGPLSAEEAALVGIDLCRALAAVHASGLVHGDVKTANVLREHGGRIVLTDFGAGSETTSGRPQPAACGTPLATAPEVLRGEPPSSAADIYGLGVLLYRLVTGRYPFTGGSVAELARRQAEGRPARLTDLRPELPPGFAAVVERALAPVPSQRYASAGEMERSLSRLVSSPGIRDRGDRRSWWWAAAVAAVALAAVAAAMFALRPPANRALAAVRAVAVLPFETTPGTPEHLGPAAALALRDRLAAVGGLEVPDTVAALRVSTPPQEPAAGARGAHTAAVLRGTVDVGGGRARLALELLAIDDGRTLWRSETTSRRGSLAEAEAAATARVARALGLREAPASEASSPPDGAPAWPIAHALLAGRFYTHRRTGAALTRAVACYRTAIEASPDLAAAHAGIARAWARTALLELPPVTPNLAWARSRAAALRALEADPDLAEAHVALAEVAFRHDWDWTIAELELSRALAARPEDPEALEILAELLSVTGRHEEALAVADRAVAAVPWSASARTVAGLVCLEAGRFARAVDHLETAIRLDPEYHTAYRVLGAVHEERGQVADAVEQWQNALALAGRPADEVEQFGRAFASAGMAGVWHWRLQRLEERKAAGGVSPALLARAHAALGHGDEALRWLARAVEEHDHHLLGVKEEPAFDALRTRPEFVALRNRLRLDDGLVTAAATGVGRPLQVDAALYRDRGGRAEALADGATTRPGDRLFLAVTSREPIYLYVLNEDAHGELFVLFPLPDLEVGNPLPAQRRHRLPGSRGDLTQDWVVTTAGGRETILLVAGRAPLAEVETEIGQLRVAEAGRPVVQTSGGTPVGVQVRGVGGLAANMPSYRTPAISRLAHLAASLAERAARGEVWLRQVVLDNPGG